MVDFVVRFLRPADWAEPVMIYAWGPGSGGDQGNWPGVPMAADPEAPGWYRFHFTGEPSSHLLFHDNQGHQTPDMKRDRDGWFSLHAGWTDAPPDAAPPASQAESPPASPATPAVVQLEPRPVQDRLDFREETIYFMLTTRFYDGDPSNNFFCRDRIRFDAQGNAVDPHWRGDFKGLIQRLDYIRDLGFTAIWITPPIENRSGLDYHGYHGYDWTRIDPRLESPDATYKDLIDAAHARDIKIIQDVVINHSCQYGIRGKVHIDHLPIKYYVPAGFRTGPGGPRPLPGQPGQLRLAQPR